MSSVFELSCLNDNLYINEDNFPDINKISYVIL